jgi:N-acetylglucosamine kinase-like BadF-type ATPase
MPRYFLGVDVGSTKTHALVTAEDGQALGFGEAGAGNHEVVGYDGLARALGQAVGQALEAASLRRADISAAGFGVSGYDWPSERGATLQAIAALGLEAAVEAVNDADLGLLAGSEEGWGVVVISGTGCNCRGWDRARRRRGRVTGLGWHMGEAAGASELMRRTVWALAHEWTRRGPPSALTPALVNHARAVDLPDLLEGLVGGRYRLDSSVAPLVFEIAAQGDPVALGLTRWAGEELAELVKAVVRQLEFEALAFEVVLAGKMFEAGPLLTEPLQASVRALAPQARFTRLAAPPVVGGVLLAMDLLGARTPAARQRLVTQFKT